MPKLKPPEPIATIPGQPIPPEDLKKVDRLRKELEPYIEMMNKGKFEIPNREFFRRGHIWATYLDEEHKKCYYRLQAMSEEIIMNAKPTNDEIKNLEMQIEKLEIINSRLLQISCNCGINIPSIEKQLYEHKKTPTFTQKEKADNLKFYRIIHSFFQNAFPDRKMEFAPSDFKMYNNWLEHILLLNTWKLIADAEFEKNEMEIKYLIEIINLKSKEKPRKRKKEKKPLTLFDKDIIEREIRDEFKDRNRTLINNLIIIAIVLAKEPDTALTIKQLSKKRDIKRHVKSKTTLRKRLEDLEDKGFISHTKKKGQGKLGEKKYWQWSH